MRCAWWSCELKKRWHLCLRSEPFHDRGSMKEHQKPYPYFSTAKMLLQYRGVKDLF